MTHLCVKILLQAVIYIFIFENSFQSNEDEAFFHSTSSRNSLCEGGWRKGTNINICCIIFSLLSVWIQSLLSNGAIMCWRGSSDCFLIKVHILMQPVFFTNCYQFFLFLLFPPFECSSHPRLSYNET